MYEKIGSIVLKTNEFGCLVITGHFGHSAVINSDMKQEEIEELMTVNMMAGDHGFDEALSKATLWAA